MIAFSKMWKDIFKLVDENKTADVNIVEKFKSGFIILEKDEREFITRDDFVDFWCKLLYYNELPKDKLLKDKNYKSEFVYKLIVKLPYVKENEGVLKLVEQ